MEDYSSNQLIDRFTQQLESAKFIKSRRQSQENSFFEYSKSGDAWQANSQNSGLNQNQTQKTIQNLQNHRCFVSRQTYPYIGQLKTIFQNNENGKQISFLSTLFIILNTCIGNIGIAAAHSFLRKDKKNYALKKAILKLMKDKYYKQTFQITEVYFLTQFKINQYIPEYDYALFFAPVLKNQVNNFGHIHFNQFTQTNQIFSVGFPSDLNKKRSYIQKCNLSSLDLYGSHGKIINQKLDLINHSIISSEGCSGSPIFRKEKIRGISFSEAIGVQIGLGLHFEQKNMTQNQKQSNQQNYENIKVLSQSQGVKFSKKVIQNLKLWVQDLCSEKPQNSLNNKLPFQRLVLEHQHKNQYSFKKGKKQLLKYWKQKLENPISTFFHENQSQKEERQKEMKKNQNLTNNYHSYEDQQYIYQNINFQSEQLIQMHNPQNQHKLTISRIQILVTCLCFHADKIKEIYLKKCQIDTEGLQKIISKKYPSLKHLDFSKNILGCKAINILCRSYQNISNLQILDLSCNLLGSLNNIKYSTIGVFLYLKDLLLHDCHFIKDNLQYLLKKEKNEQFQHLKTIDLSENYLQSKNGQVIDNTSFLENVKQLSIGKQKIIQRKFEINSNESKKIGQNILLWIKNNNLSLISLHLEDLNLNSTTSINLLLQLNTNNLQKLSLKKNYQIKNQGLQSILNNKKKFQSLSFLNLKQCGIKGEKAIQILLHPKHEQFVKNIKMFHIQISVSSDQKQNLEIKLKERLPYLRLQLLSYSKKRPRSQKNIIQID